MEPVQAATTTYESVHFLNVEYFFRLIYAFFPRGASTADYALWLAHAWSFITDITYIVTVLLLAVFTYSTIRLGQLKEEEHHLYDTLGAHEAEERTEHSRWTHIRELIESGQESDWRQAIIEADIMLDDVLGSHGYEGNSVGEKLKQGDPARFVTLQDAWEAHKVRNEIAHQGSAFQLSGNIAYRTIGRYQNVFEEFHAI